jgi:hypothetical protein
VIRKRIKLAPEKALFLFCSNSIPPNGEFGKQGLYENRDNVLILASFVSCLMLFLYPPSIAAVMSTVYEEQKDEVRFFGFETEFSRYIAS